MSFDLRRKAPRGDRIHESKTERYGRLGSGLSGTRIMSDRYWEGHRDGMADMREKCDDWRKKDRDARARVRSAETAIFFGHSPPA